MQYGRSVKRVGNPRGRKCQHVLILKAHCCLDVQMHLPSTVCLGSTYSLINRHVTVDKLSKEDVSEKFFSFIRFVISKTARAKFEVKFFLDSQTHISSESRHFSKFLFVKESIKTLMTVVACCVCFPTDRKQQKSDRLLPVLSLFGLIFYGDVIVDDRE